MGWGDEGDGVGIQVLKPTNPKFYLPSSDVLNVPRPVQLSHFFGGDGNEDKHFSL